MITTFILYLIYGLIWVLTAPLRAFADVTIESGIGAGIATAVGYFANLNNILPLSTVVTCIGIILGVELIVGIYKIIDKIRKMLPTQS